MKTVGIIGYGNMGSAFCRGLKEQGFGFRVTEKKKERVEALRAATGQKPLALKDLLDECDLILLAVKPQ